MTYEKRIKELISVELLGEVLGYKDFKIQKVEDNIIYCNGLNPYAINIDTFCFKCMNKYKIVAGEIITSFTIQESIIKAANYIIERNRGR